MAAIIEVNYFNAFWLKKVVDKKAVIEDNGATIANPSWPGIIGNTTGLNGYPAFPGNALDNGSYTEKELNWCVEEARIRGGYNNTNVNYGVKAYLVEDEPNAVVRGNSLIYSGIFNSRTGVNQTNQFPVGEDITKSADPINGSIQKLYAEDTNLIILQENKVSRALIDKDAIYSAEGGGAVTSSNLVIGVIQPYAGNFGISRNPESFAAYGYRKYFTDKNRNAVLRLSNDGITEISTNGMSDYFRDQFTKLDGSAQKTGKLIGGWDIYTKEYTLSIQPFEKQPEAVFDYSTLSFDERVLGWQSFISFKPSFMTSANGKFYTIGGDSPENGGIYEHYFEGNGLNRNTFYGKYNKSSIKFIFNPSVSTSKVFKTIGYEGSNGWQVDSMISDQQGLDKGLLVWESFNDTTAQVYSLYEGAYKEDNIQYYAGFYRKENKYVANLINSSTTRPQEVVWGVDMSGIKGFLTTVTMSTDATTNLGGEKELFAVSSEYVLSAL